MKLYKRFCVTERAAIAFMYVLVISVIVIGKLATADRTISLQEYAICNSDLRSGSATFARNYVVAVESISAQNDLHRFGALKEGNDSNSVYALFQDCLVNASAKILSCSPSFQGQALNAGCYMRYDTSPFFNLTSGGSKHTKLSIILGTIATVAVMGVGLGLLIWRRKINSRRLQQRLLQRNEAQNESGGQSFAIPNSQLNFKYETLEIATKNFDPANKLGEGGFGSVYKGTLPDGREIAVKRLFYNMGQDVREFLNEVNLISCVQHKNLVKLLGCSAKGPERLLVYEYLANKSLDRFLFAVRLAYLHEGSEIRIIHRDIKPSNVLLDQNLKPKIADFGLARYFAAERSHLSTGVAGTLGYMAPEYMVRGQLTEKADIFSFGVLVLEILSGKRNTPAEATESLLAVIWNHYQSEKVADIIDPNCNTEEALRVVNVAFLCTQTSATLRPPMSKVVQMLTNKEQKLPVPRQPPFVELQDASDQTFHLPYNLVPLLMTLPSVFLSPGNRTATIASFQRWTHRLRHIFFWSF
eukprot:Gb_01662 [translate_table: standard]